ncbi:MAG: hypothetical protein RLN60_02190 [Phycisphaerales bacterium]
MGKRQFDESEYDPLASDLARDVKLAVAPPASVTRANPTPQVTESERATNTCALKAKRYKVTPDEDLALARFVLRLQEASGTKVNLSLLNRIGNTLLMDAADELIREVRAAGSMRQPPNNDALAYADFENTWLRIVERAVRRRGARS